MEERANYDDEFDVDLSDVLGELSTEADQPAAEEAGTEEQVAESTPAAAGEQAEADDTADKPAEAEASETGEAAPEKADSFHLKWLDEQRDVSREEVIALAQKGMDYDRVRGKLDEQHRKNEVLEQFRRDHGQNVEELSAYLKESGAKSVAEVLDALRVNAMTGKGVARDVAVARVAQQRAERALKQQTEQAAAQKAAAELPSRKAAEDLDRFAKAHPDVKLLELLPKLKTELEETQDLETAWQRHELKRLEQERAELARQLAAERQNNSNRKRSAGSQQTAGGERQTDAFLEALFEDD